MISQSQLYLSFESPSLDCLFALSTSLLAFSLIATLLIAGVLLQLDDTALQLYKEGDYGSYLDLDASINEQQEEFENFQSKWVNQYNF